MPADRRLLPRPARRRGRNERAIDAVAAALRRVDAYDEIAAARVTLARSEAAAIDRLEDDPDRSEHTIGSVGRVLRDLLADLAGHLGTNDDLAALFAALDQPADQGHPQNP